MIKLSKEWLNDVARRAADEEEAWNAARPTWLDLEDEPSAITEESKTAGEDDKPPGDRSDLASWRSALSRVSLHPAIPLQIQLAVEPSPSPGRVSLSCIILTTDVRVPPEMCHEHPYDQPTTWVAFREEAAANATPAEQVQAVRDLVRRALVHEVDECVLVDGRPSGAAHSTPLD